MPRVALLLEYDGTAYCGWQRQKHCKSVQQHIESAASKVANERIVVHCAGRTDSGVHATGQTVHFDTTAQREDRGWVLGCNSQLPADISVRAAVQPIDDFHARFQAEERQYRYIIANSISRYALFATRTMTVHEPLDEQLMQQAAQTLVGEHDFSAFRAAGCQAKHPTRTIRAIRVARRDQWLVVDIAANAFLHHMVRNIVGLLISVGVGLRTVACADDVLQGRDRTKAPSMAAASGLYLTRVIYPANSGLEWQLPDHLNFPPIMPLIPTTMN